MLFCFSADGQHSARQQDFAKLFRSSQSLCFSFCLLFVGDTNMFS